MNVLPTPPVDHGSHFQSLLNAVAQAVEASHATLVIHTGRSTHCHIVERQSGSYSLKTCRNFEDCPAASVVTDGQPQYRAGLQTYPCLDAFNGPASWMGIPLVMGDHVTGVVEAFNPALPADPDAQQTFLRIFNTLLGELFRPLLALFQHGQSDRNLLLELLTALAAAPDFDHALDEAMRLCCAYAGWVYAEAWTPGPDGLLRMYTAHNPSGDERFQEYTQASRRFVFSPGEGLVGRVWASGRMEWRRDVGSMQQAQFVRQIQARQAGLKAAVSIPVLLGEHRVCVLVFCADTIRDEDDQAARFIALIAAQIGVIMRSKRA